MGFMNYKLLYELTSIEFDFVDSKEELGYEKEQEWSLHRFPLNYFCFAYR